MVIVLDETTLLLTLAFGVAVLFLAWAELTGVWR
jgi:hypothetical protein